MKRRRSRRQNSPLRPRGSWSDLPIRIGKLSWPEFWRAMIFTVVVLTAFVAILLWGGKDASHLLRIIHWL